MMDFLGLKPEDYAAENTVLVWPDNWAAAHCFAAFGTGDWMQGPGGATGLKSEAFREVRLSQRIRMADWPEMLESIRVMEAVALDEIHKE